MTDKKLPEVLAPAGSFEALTAAIRSGADAVYLGTKAFNARQGASNFDSAELKRAVKLCRMSGTKLHITLNTLVSDSELEEALSEAKHVCLSGADVLILQDLGLAYLVGQSAPGLLRHASTQMSVQTSAGVRLLERLGYDRVVLARELSKPEIAQIVNSTHLETECFVHGALCMCVSGQCYLSSVLGQRSGNRGMCAQPCRLPFAAPDGTGFDLSLKDNSLVRYLKELGEMGVTSFKIEGRMKRPEYVAAAVSACRTALRGENTDKILEQLKAVFSRTGFTDGYYRAELGREMFGTRRKEDVTSAAGVLSQLQRLYDKPRQSIPVTFMLTAVRGENVTLAARAGGFNAFADSGEEPQEAENKPSTSEGLSEKLEKCGGTFFYMEDAEVELDEGVFVPVSTVNRLRREVLEQLEERLSAVKSCSFTPAIPKMQRHRATRQRVYGFFSDLKELPHNIGLLDTAYVPFDTGASEIKSLEERGLRVGISIPRGLFGKEKAVAERLRELKEEGVRLAYCQNLDALQLALEAGMEVHTGFGLNLFNSVSVQVLEDFGVKESTLSYELTLRQIERIGGALPRGIIAYGRLPLMLTRNCPLKNGRSCRDCDRKGSLTDRMGVSFPVRCTYGCSEMFNSRPLWLADRLHEVRNVDFITLYFTTESKSEIERVIDAYTQGNDKRCHGEFTRGLYYRAVE